MQESNYETNIKKVEKLLKEPQINTGVPLLINDLIQKKLKAHQDFLAT